MRQPMYRETGHPSHLMHGGDAGGGEVIGNPGVGKHILIHSILASAASTLTETDTNGDVIVYAPAGCSTLGGALRVAENKAVFNDSSTNVTILYDILDNTR